MNQVDENMTRIVETIQEKQIARNKLQELDMRLRMLNNNLRGMEQKRTNREEMERNAKAKIEVLNFRG